MIETRDYSGSDSAAFLGLYRDCLDHYRIAPATPEGEARILTLLAQQRHMACLMAFEGDAAAGFATYGLTFPAGHGIALYMKELFVSPMARGRGVGRALLAGLIDRAQAEGCSRIDWQTDGSNTGAQAFYAAIGAPRFEKYTFRIAEHAFSRFRHDLTGSRG